MKRTTRSKLRISLAVFPAGALLLWSTSLGTGRVSAASWLDWEGPTYLNIEAGASILQDTKFKDLTGATPGKATASFDPGVRFDVALGYRFTERWSAEIESGVNWNNLDTLGGVEADLALYQIPVFLNGKYEFKTSSKFVPYLGLGLGPLIHKLDQDVGIQTESAVAVTFGAQAMAGVRYQLDERTSLGLGYKFMASTEAEFKDNLQTKAEPFFTHSLFLQLNWRF
jgi:outer membrane protein W